MTGEEIGRVNTVINAVVAKFRQTPNVFLTEEDLRVHLCNKLLQNFGTEQQTQDHDISISLHAEVRWYGNGRYGTGRLRSRSDIVLVDVSNLDVLRYAKMPSKGYGFNIPKGIIELKFRRPNGESKPAFLNKIRNDLKKLNRLREVFRDKDGICQTEFWMVIFDKKARLDRMPMCNGIRLTYEFSNQSAQVQRSHALLHMAQF